MFIHPEMCGRSDAMAFGHEMVSTASEDTLLTCFLVIGTTACVKHTAWVPSLPFLFLITPYFLHYLILGGVVSLDSCVLVLTLFVSLEEFLISTNAA